MITAGAGLPRFAVVVDPDSLLQSGRGGISGRIHVDVDGFRFPDGQWSDLVVATLLGWLDALSACGDGGTLLLRFLDGPFLVECELRPDRDTLVRCISSSRQREVLSESEIAHREIVDAIVDAARQVLSECARRRWKSVDLQRTQSLVEILRGSRRSR